MSHLIFSTDSNQAKQLSRLSKQNKLRRIYLGIYTDDLKSPIEDIVRKDWMSIVSHIVSSGILSFRTAMDLKPTPFKGGFIIFVTSTYFKTIRLPGLLIKVSKGNNTSFIENVLPGLARSSRPRFLLENLSSVRSADFKNIKTIGMEGVENFLAKEMMLRGEEALNQLRDQAKEVALEIGYASEYKKLNQIISSLLSSHDNKELLVAPYAKAVVKKEPYDINRLDLFESLAIYLKKCRFINREFQYNKISFKNLSFFESYFSNFIEGTEFLIDEAEDIVFKGREIENRHADSHDVLSNFILTNDYSEMQDTPKSPEALLDILKQRHAYLMKERLDKRPGDFKEKPNQSGNTNFVMPSDVIGTLTHGFEIYKVLKDGFEKALFMQFMVSEVHPFDDGNGRLSRIMMNAELVRGELFKIIVPSVHRDNYLNGLRLASRDSDFRIFCKALDQAQAYVQSIDWHEYGEAREKLERDGAMLTPDEGLPTFNRVLRELLLSELAT